MIADKQQYLELLLEKERRIKYNKLKHYAPYQKQIDFHNYGGRARALLPVNQEQENDKRSAYRG